MALSPQSQAKHAIDLLGTLLLGRRLFVPPVSLQLHTHLAEGMDHLIYI